MITALGALTLQLLQSFLGFFYLLWVGVYSLVRQSVFFRFRLSETLEQLYEAGIRSLAIVIVSLVFMSLLLLSEFSYHLNLVLRQTSLVPAFSTLMMIRELGPVITSLLLTSRLGAAFAAELGLMKITDQLDALKLFSIDWVEYLLLPRWIASVVASVCLTILAIATAIGFNIVFSSVLGSQTSGEFVQTMFAFARYRDLSNALVKAAVFGTITAFSAAYHGTHCQPGSRGVGNAATRAVVQGSIFIIVADFLLTYLMYAL